MMVAEAQGKEKVRGCVLFNAAGGLTSFRDEELPWVLRPLWVFVRVVLFGDVFGPGLFKRFSTEENVRSVLSQVRDRRRARDENECCIVCVFVRTDTFNCGCATQLNEGICPLRARTYTSLYLSHFTLPQVYGNKTAVDDELVDILLIPGGDDGAEEVFLKVLRAPAGPSPEQLLPRIQVPIIGIWGVSRL